MGQNARDTIKRFMAETDAEAEALLAAAEAKFGHPVDWPLPPPRMPRWYEFRMKKRFQAVAAAFGPIVQTDLDAFHAELHKGQSVYEDAGGFLLRCYRALVALPVEEPYTYPQAVSDLLASAQEDR